MNKRQKKKEYKKLAGSNPPGWMQYSGWLYHVVIGKPWGVKKSIKLDNVSEFAKIMTEIRRIKKNRGGCYAQRGRRKIRF